MKTVSRAFRLSFIWDLGRHSLWLGKHYHLVVTCAANCAYDLAMISFSNRRWWRRQSWIVTAGLKSYDTTMHLHTVMHVYDVRYLLSPFWGDTVVLLKEFQRMVMVLHFTLCTGDTCCSLVWLYVSHTFQAFLSAYYSFYSGLAAATAAGGAAAVSNGTHCTQSAWYMYKLCLWELDAQIM